MRTLLKATASIAALVQSAACYAQTTTSPAGPPPTDDIIVTAQKIDQSAQKVPAALEVLSAEALDRKAIASAYSLDREVSGLKIFDLGPSVNVVIRGVGNQSALSTSDPTAAFNVDGVYRSRATSLNGALFDISRIEVLKGPQGTLYGRNATTGALNVISNAPTHEFAAAGLVEVGDYNLLRTNAMVNVPISDTLAFRAAFGSLRHSGYQTDGYDDADQLGARARLLFTPTDRFSILLTGDYSSQYGYGQGNVIIHPDKIGETPNPLYLVPAGASDYYGNEAPGNLHNRDWGVTAEFNYDAGWANLFFQPAYRRTTSMSRGFTSGSTTGVLNDFTADQYSAEARLSAPTTSAIKWVLGAFYFSENLDNTSALATALPTVVTVPASDRLRNYTNPSLDTKSYAFFGQITVPIVERFRVTGGLRYTHDSRNLGGSIYSSEYSTALPSIEHILTAADGYPPATLAGSATFNHVDWKAGLEVDLARRSMLYASASTGYKAGGLNAVNASSLGPIQAAAAYSPERLMEYTGGIKNRFFNDRVTLNLSYFNWVYRDRQILNVGAGGGVIVSNLTPATFPSPVVCFSPPPGVVCSFPNISVGKQLIQGIDVDGSVRISPVDRIGFSGAWLDGRYTNDTNNAGAPAGGTNPGLGAVDLRNKRIPYSPTWSLTADYTHDFRFDSGAVVSFYADVQWVSWQYVNANLGQTPNPAAAAVANPIGLRAAYQPSYTLADISLTYTSPNKKFAVNAWVHNLTDVTIKSNSSLAILSGGVGVGVPGATNSVWLASLRPPRTYGASFSFKF